MKVGIDCRPLSRPQGGIGRYTLEIVRRLVRRESVIWFLYFSKKPSDEVLACLMFPNVKIYIAEIDTSFKELYWYHVSLPRWLKRDSVEVFWSPRHHLPAMLGRDIFALLTVHDFTWRVCPKTMRLPNYWSERLQMPGSIGRADKIFCVSRATLNQLVAFYPEKASSSEVVSCGTTFMNPKTTAVAGLPDSFLLFVGTPEPRKNLGRILEAYAGLPDDIQRSYPLLVIGGNGWGVPLEGLVARNGLEGKVVILGPLPEDELSFVYSRASLLLMPSIYEGFGLPLLEAFQFGIPAVTSATGALAEVAGEAAVLVNPLSVYDIKCGILTLLKSYDCYSRCSEQAFVQAQKFSWERSADAIAENILAVNFNNSCNSRL